MNPDILDLIYSIGRAEGWGVSPNPNGGFQFDKYNPYTIAPFGLIYDAKQFPQIMNDPNLAVEFMISKLTGKPTDRVRNELGLERFSGTVIPGLVDKSGNVDLSKLDELRNRYAPIGATNDPNNLNDNWLNNVKKFIGESPFVGSVLPYLPELPRLSNDKPIHTDTPLLDQNASTNMSLEERIINFLKNAGWFIAVFIGGIILVIIGSLAVYKGE